MKYEYKGKEKKIRLRGKKMHFKPGEVYDFDKHPGASFKKVAAKKEKVSDGDST